MTDEYVYRGHCHCNSVRYELTLPKPLQEFPLVCCNCSICVRKGMLLAYVKPEQVKFLHGKDTLKKYVWGDKDIAFVFCPHCGVDIGNEPVDFANGVNGSRRGINARTLEDIDFNVQMQGMTLDMVNGRSFPDPGVDRSWKLPKTEKKKEEEAESKRDGDSAPAPAAE